mgnify:CR=1 FL=1
MELFLTRRVFSPRSTIGNLCLEGPETTLCDTLEDVDRHLETAGADAKIKGETAIPRGRYRVAMAPSAHYQRDMPHLEAVPYYTHVMVHWGNSAKDTLGCILVGTYAPGVPDWISGSKVVWDKVMEKIKPSIEAGTCWITVS